MLFLSPAKLLIILVIALVVLGPDKLPKMAKQIGSLWGDFRRFREKLESEVRGNLPDLPSTDTITQAVRSPLSFLDRLADAHSGENDTASVLSAADPPQMHGNALEPSSGAHRPTRTVEPQVRPTPLSEALGADPAAGVAHQVRPKGSFLQENPGLN